ncbi:SLBB domain-containing protein [Kosmotoga pacifica]|uniref:Polysaccharide export protein n=1 Tax=Kosmotoga pacifica TaxID=1330330 RepID=A0A0G2ZCK0_9BACT|nr:SLBB domain-containing protein [Kosmotoga pacifica]AKI96483.1 hypothetical protein IX53_00060 [Kosmotoga pacifica]
MKRLSLIIIFLVLTVVGLSAYQLRSGDLLRIYVYGHEDLTVDVAVGPDGWITVPPVGSLKVLNMTLDEASKELTRRYSSLITDPKITVTVQDYAPFIYYVLGEVRNPGNIVLDAQQASIAQLIAAAGGLKDTAEENEFQIVKKDGKRLTITVENYPKDTKLTTIFLEPGDSLFILNGYSNWIKVIGEVGKPGVFKYQEGVTLTRVIAEAGGIKETGDPEEIAVITRLGNSTQRQVYNLNDIFAGKSADPVLKKGSTVIVSNTALKAIKIIGEVRNPGIVSYREGLTLLRAISDAGGFTSTSGDNVLVISDKDTLTFTVNDLLKGSVEDPFLKPGTTIVVPRETEKYVYLLSPDFSGRVDFSFDEKLTIRNVLLKTGRYQPDKDEEIEIIEPDGTKKSFSMKELENNDSELSSGALVSLSLTIDYAYITGEVSSPGIQYIERYEEATLRNLLIRSGVKTETAGSVEVISDTRKVYTIEDALISEDIITPGTVIIVDKRPEKYVYLIGDEISGGKLELSRDEPLTLKNVLARRNLLFTASDRIVKVIMNDSEFSIKLSDLKEKDISLIPGSVIIITDLFTRVYVLGEVKNPGLVVFEPNEIATIASALSKAGGLLSDSGNIQILVNGTSTEYPLDTELISRTVLDNDTILYVDRQPERYVYLISDQEGGRIEFSEDEKPTLRHLLSKLNMLDFETDESITIYFPNGQKVDIPMSSLENDDVDLEYGSIIVDRYSGRGISVLGEVRSPGTFTTKSSADLRLSRAIAARGGFLSTADDRRLMLIDSTLGRAITVDFADMLEKGEDLYLKPGTTVYVPKLEEKYAYITGEVKDPGIKHFDIEEKFTLGALIGKAGGVTPNASEVHLITNNGSKIIALEDAVISSEELVPGALVNVIKNLERYVYIVSKEKGGRIDFASSEKLTLKTALVKAGLLDYRLNKTITVQKPNGSQLEIKPWTLKNSDIILDPGSVIVYPEPGVSVYVLGAVNSPGKIRFTPGELPTLSRALALAGGTSGNFSGYITISDENGMSEIEFDAILKGKAEDLILMDDTILFVQESSDRYVYLISPDGGGRIEFEKNEKMTLKNLLARKNYLSFSMKGQVVLQYPDGKKEIFELSKLEKEDIFLTGGTIVMFPDALRELYILGAVNNPGVKVFEPSESLTLTSLISKAGGTLEEAFNTEVFITDASGKTFTVNLKEILEGKSLDRELEPRSLVYVPFYQPIRINVLGEVNKPGVVEFGPDEKVTLLNAISKAGGMKENASDIVKLGRGEGNYRWLDLIDNVDLPLEDGAVIYVPEDTGRYVYVLGQVLRSGRVDFDKYENITLAAVVAKAGGVLETAADEVKIIQPDGRVRTMSLLALENKLDNPEIQPGSTVVISETLTRVTILGQVRNPGTYVFGRKEVATIATAIAKAGGISDIDTVEKILLYTAGKVRSIDDLTTEKTPIEGEALIYVKPVEELVFTVLGEVKTPGTFSYTSKHLPSLTELLTRAGGVNGNAEEVQVIMADTLEVFSVEDARRSIEPFKNEAIVIVTGGGSRYISVIGEVNNPGLVDLGDFERPVTLGEVLAHAGGLKNSSAEYVEIIGPDSKRKTLSLHGEDLSQNLTENLEAGSIVYVPPVYLKVLVLGEVKNPGVVNYTTDMNLLDAIALSGGFTAEAYKNVLLIKNVTGGNPEIEYIDLTGKKLSDGSMKLEPGDVIYVPQSRFVDIKEVLSFVSSVLSITGVSLHLVNPGTY